MSPAASCAWTDRGPALGRGDPAALSPPSCCAALPPLPPARMDGQTGTFCRDSGHRLLHQLICTLHRMTEQIKANQRTRAGSAQVDHNCWEPCGALPDSCPGCAQVGANSVPGGMDAVLKEWSKAGPSPCPAGSPVVSALPNGGSTVLSASPAWAPPPCPVSSRNPVGTALTHSRHSLTNCCHGARCLIPPWN